MDHGKHTDGHTDGHTAPGMAGRHYTMLGINLALSLLIMYVGMFAMIWSWGEFVQNVNFLYMALVMWAPMAIVMMLTMRSMYTDARLNTVLYLALAAVFLLSFAGIRAQGLVGDRQFLSSMIPHHSGAVLMCNRASLRDAEIRELCFGPEGIVAGQRREIDQMKAIQQRL
ncbi:MAG: DUF305 domain-containing protein [Sphingomonadales bacterium 12-68-11]|nr:MAG: DUF305 domain-containing protein [Sphingomonadales bacterium 12-68-11]OYX16852.1 MAG: DUF305 domain-containing protein [Sphingomonadales bacterium 32-67-7]